MLLSMLISSAFASTTYPAALQEAAGMPCAPTCTVCHDSIAGGTGTVTRDFGLAMMDRGLLGGSQVDLLTTAFDTLSADGVDSDADGTVDADELADGNDPNPDGTAFCGTEAPTLPEYGCFNAAQSPIGALGVLGAAAAVVGMRRRRG